MLARGENVYDGLEKCVLFFLAVFSASVLHNQNIYMVFKSLEGEGNTDSENS